MTQADDPELVDHQHRALDVNVEDVVECWEVSGDVDYLAHFVCADLPAYEALTARLIGDPKLGVARIVSHVALRPIRRFAGYPEELLRRKGEQS